jgi:hypothetical protein
MELAALPSDAIFGRTAGRTGGEILIDGKLALIARPSDAIQTGPWVVTRTGSVSVRSRSDSLEEPGHS